jgi:hypothetical protein
MSGRSIGNLQGRPEPDMGPMTIITLNLRKELGHTRIQAGHHNMVVVHLACMRHDRNLICLRPCRNLTCLTDPTNPVRVELNIVERVRFEQIAKAKDRELMLSARNWYAPRTPSVPCTHACRPG